jgi:hypothetical protein
MGAAPLIVPVPAVTELIIEVLMYEIQQMASANQAQGERE